MPKYRGKQKSLNDLRDQMARIGRLGESLYGRNYYSTERATRATDTVLNYARNLGARNGLYEYQSDDEYSRTAYKNNPEMLRSFNRIAGAPKMDANKKYSRAARMGKANGGRG